MSDPEPTCTATAYGPCAPYLTVEEAAALGCCSGLALDDVPAEGEGDPTPGADAEIFAAALLSASRRVFMATGYRFWGCCEATIRPCRQSCAQLGGSAFPADFPWASWPWAEQPPGWVSGLVPVWACSCGSADGCSCVSWDRIPLPLLPAREITEVKIGADVLAASAYSLYANAWLMRIDGEVWPSCQAVEKPAGEEGTWSVTYRHGLDLPPEAKSLVAAYACELVKLCRPGSECALPVGMRVDRRDGADFAIIEPADYREKGLTGFGPLDDWISLLNGGHVTEPPRIYRPGREVSAPILEPSV